MSESGTRELQAKIQKLEELVAQREQQLNDLLDAQFGDLSEGVTKVSELRKKYEITRGALGITEKDLARLKIDYERDYTELVSLRQFANKARYDTAKQNKTITDLQAQLDQLNAPNRDVVTELEKTIRDLEYDLDQVTYDKDRLEDAIEKLEDQCTATDQAVCNKIWAITENSPEAWASIDGGWDVKPLNGAVPRDLEDAMELLRTHFRIAEDLIEEKA